MQENPKLKEIPADGTRRSAIIKRVVIATVAMLLSAVLAATGVVFLRRGADPYGNRILNNVMVGDVCVGGMTKSEAKAALKPLAEKAAHTDLEVRHPLGFECVTVEGSHAKLNVSAAVKEAFAYGREGDKDARHAVFQASQNEGHWIALENHLNLDMDYVQEIAEKVSEILRNCYQESTVTLGFALPDLTREDLQENELPPVMIRMGSPGYEVDAEAIKDSILAAYRDGSLVADWSQSEPTIFPKELTVADVLNQVKVEPVNFDMDRTTMTVIPGAFGCTFSLPQAQKALATAQYHEVITLPMELTAPEIGREDAWFLDTLGFAETPHSTNANRNINMSIACGKLDGLILQPGEQLSYNELLGQRTLEAGFKPAPAYSGTTLINTPGGGICQVSSTLYLASVYAEMEAVERVSHGFKPSYMLAGTDATVSWPYPDLKIKNPTERPVKIKAQVTEEKVQVWFYGIDTRTYDIKLTFSEQSRNPGTYVKSFVNKYDKATGEFISKEYLAISSYMN